MLLASTDYALEKKLRWGIVMIAALPIISFCVVVLFMALGSVR
jgi:hypothetical protein